MSGRPPMAVLVAAAVLAVLAICALAPGLFEPAAPGAIHPAAVLIGPSATYPLGTDVLGRDILSRIVAGTGQTLSAPLVLALATLTLSLPLALIAAFRGGAVDTAVSRTIDVVYALPALVIAIVVAGVLGGGIWIAVAVLTVLHTPQTVRVVRAAVLERRRLAYVEAAEALGVAPWRIMLRHLLAPILPLVEAIFFVRLSYGLVELSSLSFLGLGAAPGSTNWGRMLAENRSLISVNAWLALGPGLALVVAAVSANLVGDWVGERGRPSLPRRLWSRGRQRPTELAEPGEGRRSAGDPVGALTVDGLRIVSRSRGGEVEIVAEVALSVRPGEAVGLVGESGSGKSLTARALLGLLPAGVHATGRIAWHGRDAGPDLEALRGRRISLLLQDPATMLDPLERCGAQVLAGLRDDRGRRLTRGARRTLAIERLAEVGLGDPALAERYPFELSGGQRQRVAVAAAIARRPELLIADEPTSSLDPSARQDLLDLLDRLRRERRMGLLLITHNLGAAFSVCDRVNVMYAGRIVEAGASAELAACPRHPYSLGLLLADPQIDRRVSDLGAIAGSVPAPGSRPDGCAFAPRCRWAAPACRAAAPPAIELAPGRVTRCVRVEEIGPELARLRSAERGAEPARARAAIPGAGGEPIVTVRALRVALGARPPVLALDGVDLDLAAGSSTGLVGDSGAGKTTLARCLVGLAEVTAGTVRVGAVQLPGAGRADRETVRRTAQIVFQDPAASLNPALRIGTALHEALALAAPPGGNAPLDVPGLLELVGLPSSYAGRRPNTLSGGERQRVAIARALARSPRLLICDEITAALDVSVQAQILELLRGLQATLGLAILLISHDLTVMRQIADEIHVLAHGRIVESGTTEVILDHPAHEVTQRLLAASRAPIGVSART